MGQDGAPRGKQSKQTRTNRKSGASGLTGVAGTLNEASQQMGELKREVLELALGAQRGGPLRVSQPVTEDQAGRTARAVQPRAARQQAALFDALHDVYLQGVHVGSLILALRATEVRRLLGGASPLAGQGQVEGGVSWGRG